MANDARKTALYILNTLDKGNQTLDSVLEDVLEKKAHLSRRDRALLHALVYGALRWRGLLDWIIDHYSTTRMNRIDPNILNILRLGLFQIMHLSRIPVSAAVHSSVEMAKSTSSIWVVRYVNALLRKAAIGYANISLPDPEKDPVSALAVKKSFPEWLVKRWLDRFGFKETEMLCDAVNTIPPITVRTNTLNTSRDELARSLQGIVEKLDRTRYSPDGLCFFTPKTPIPEIKAFKKGGFQVQDEAAQLVALLLDPKPDETVLDACAGLGGKTGHIAQMMKNRGCIVAMDKQGEKLMRLTSEMRRLGVSIVKTRHHDLRTPGNRTHLGTFDRILLDAPCSGLGVIRRNPDIKWLLSPKQLRGQRERQATFLDNLAHLVRSSGILVYAVCSSEPEENDEIVSGFLKKHPEFAADRDPGSLSERANSLVDQHGYLRTFPHIHNMDGFFSVRFKRIK